MTRLAALLVLVAGGCEALQPGSETSRPWQEEAVALVWHDVYGRADEPPHVRWVTTLPCVDPNSGRPGFPTPVGCREGLCLGPEVVSVAWRDEDTFSTTTLAHELVHAKQARDGIWDPGHSTADFAEAGAADQGRWTLMENGL